MESVKINQAFEIAKEQYAAVGVDVEAAIARADAVPVSMHCWQGDDVIGFDGSDALSGGIQTTGNYPGRARTPGELRADIEAALRLIPGRTKLSLHASYAEKGGRKIDRDAYTIEQFAAWLDWAKQTGLGLDFNPTYFSHPRMDGDFSLSSFDPGTRSFWIEHGKRCREIALEFAKGTGQPCTVNYWMPDGYKDVCVDTVRRRDLMSASLDAIFKEPVDGALVPSASDAVMMGVWKANSLAWAWKATRWPATSTRWATPFRAASSIRWTRAISIPPRSSAPRSPRCCNSSIRSCCM